MLLYWIISFLLKLLNAIFIIIIIIFIIFHHLTIFAVQLNSFQLEDIKMCKKILSSI